jgi:hypothetical protein
MITSTRNILTILLCVLFFAPVAIGSTPVAQHSSSLALEHFSAYSLSASPATARAQSSGFNYQPVTEKKDAAGSKWYAEVVQVLGNVLLALGAFFAWVTGNILDYSLQELVFGMGKLINEGGVGVAIDSAWRVIRDLCNLAFIFGFIYLGIRTIIDPESSSVKRTLSQIIIGAFLINFSLYITKFIIDISNFTAYTIYNAMVSGDGSISTLMFQMLGVSSFYSTVQINPQMFVNATGMGMISFYVMGMLLLIVAAFIFLASAILLITRFVALVFIMIASPVLFAATIFPKTASKATEIWGKLFSQAFFAPLFLLLMLVSMMIMQSFTSIMSHGVQLSAAFSGSNTQFDAFGVVVSFVVVMFFLIQSLLIAQKLGVSGGSLAVSVGNKIKGNVQSFVGRNTIGRVGNRVAAWQENARYNGGTGSRAAAAVARFTGVNATANATYGGSKSRNTAQNEQREIDRKHAKAQEVGKISSAVSESTRLRTEREKIEKDPSSTQAQKDDIRTRSDAADMKMEQALSSASTEQTLELLKKHKDGSDERNTIVANLSASQFDSVMKVDAEKLDDKKKAELRTQRSSAVQNRLIGAENQKRQARTPAGAPAPAAATIADVIGKASGKDLDAMDFETIVLPNAGMLSGKQIDDMSLGDTGKTRLRDARKSALIAEFNKGGAGAGAGDLFKRITSETERAKLPVEILREYASAEYLTQGVLTKMLDNDSILTTDRTNIRIKVETYHKGKGSESTFTKFFDNTPAGNQYL